MKTEKQIIKQIEQLRELEYTSSPQEWWQILKEIKGLEWVLDD